MPHTPFEQLTALEAYLRERFGGRFTVETSTVSIGTSLTKAIEHDFERMGLTFINIGTNDIHLTPSRDATSSVGVLLGANGGFLSLTARDDLILVGWDWFAVASSSPTDLLVFNVKRYAD